MTDEQGDPAPGCPAHDFGNALAWRWVKVMPRGLKGGFLTMLYALRTIASASGQLRFTGNGRPFRIQDIARAAGCREQDARRYLEAAILAGVVQTIGARRRGRPTLYSLVITPWPDWTAAAAYLKATARPRQDAGSDAGSSGHSGPNSDGEEVRATEARTGEGKVRATEARMSSGHRGPNGSGHRGPNVPGVSHGLPHETTGVRRQLEGPAGAGAGAGAREGKGANSGQAGGGGGPVDEAAAAERDLAHCAAGCGVLLIRGGTWCSAHRPDGDGAPSRPQGPVQGAFPVVVPSGPTVSSTGARVPVPWPREDPSAPTRTCGCGRSYRAQQPGPCPDCVAARHIEQAGAG